MKKVIGLMKKKQSARPSASTSLPNLSSSPLRRASVSSVASSVLTKVTKRADGQGHTKLHQAVLNEDVDKVKKIVAKNDVSLINASDNKGQTALHLAAEKGQVTLLWPLLSHGAIVQVRDALGSTPLHKAVAGGHVETANMLLDRGCQLDVSDCNGDTVLHLANRNQTRDMLATLLRKGANPDIRNKQGESPLHEAILNGQVTSAQMLLRCGASVNLAGPRGFTPLILACMNPEAAELVETLLDYEADPKIRDLGGKTAVDYANGNGLHDTVDMIVKYMQDMDAEGGEGAKDSFEEEEEDFGSDDLYPPLGLPMSNTGGASVREEKDPQVGVVKTKPTVESDISSWGSDSPPLASLENRQSEAGNLKHSRGILDLSKFLRSDDEQEESKEEKNADTVHPDQGKEALSRGSVSSWSSHDSKAVEKEAPHQDISPNPQIQSNANEADTPNFLFSHEKKDLEVKKPESRNGVVPPLTAKAKDHSAQNLSNKFGSERYSISSSGRRARRKKRRSSRSMRSQRSKLVRSDNQASSDELDNQSRSSLRRLAFSGSDLNPGDKATVTKQQEKISSGPAKTDSPQSQSKSVEEAKKTFMQKISTPRFNKDDDHYHHTTRAGMLTPDIVDMDKPDLLVYIQKLHLQLDGMKVTEASHYEKSLITTIESLKRQLEAKDLHISSISENLTKATTDFTIVEENNKRKNCELQTQLQEVRTENANFQAELKETQRMKAAEISELNLFVQNLKREHQAAISNNQALEKEKSTLISKNEELRLELDKMTKLNTETNSKLKNDLNAEKEALEQRIEDLQIALDTKNASCETTSDEMKILSDKIQSKETEVSDLHMEIKALRQETVDLKASTVRQNNLNSAVKEKLQKDKETLISENNELKKQLEVVTASNDKYSSQVESLERSVQEISAKGHVSSEHFESEVKMLRGQLEDRDHKLRDLTAELKSLQVTKQKLEELNATVQSKLEKSRLAEATENQNVRDENVQLEKQLKKITLERDEYSHKITELKAEIQNFNRRQETEVDNLKTDLERAKNEAERLQGLLEIRDKELSAASSSLALKSNSKILEQEKLLTAKENESLEVNLHLKFSEEKVKTLENHVQHLQQRIQTIESEFERVAKEKKAILFKLKKKESDISNINIEVVDTLKLQLKNERQKLEKEMEKVQHLESQKVSLEREVERMGVELSEMKEELVHTHLEKKKLKLNLEKVNQHAHDLDLRLQTDQRQQSKQKLAINSLQETIQLVESKNQLTEQKMAQVLETNEKEQTKMLNLHRELDKLNTEKKMNANLVDSLNAKIARLQVENRDLGEKMLESNEKLCMIHNQTKQTQDLSKEVERRGKIIEDLEERFSNLKQIEAKQYQEELKKVKLKYEILARNEINKKLSEVNSFLEERAEEQVKSEKSREDTLQKIQKDLGEKLEASKNEVRLIREQLKDTAKTVKHLENVLKRKEQELVLERNVRKQLEKQFDQTELKRILPRAYF